MQTQKSRFKVVTLSAVCVLALGSIACSDDGEPGPATFGGESDIQQQLLVSVGSGSFAAIGVFLGSAFASQDENQTCPVVNVSGPVTTVEGGCTDDDGNRFEGKITLDNVAPIFGEAPNPGEASRIEFEDFRWIFDGNTMAFDGVLTEAADGASGPTATIDMTLLLDGTNVDTGEAISDEMGLTADFTCDENTGCVYGSGSTGFLRSVGSFDISGNNSNVVTLTGANTLTMDLGSSEDCVALAIDGAPAGEVCDEDDEL